VSEVRERDTKQSDRGKAPTHGKVISITLHAIAGNKWCKAHTRWDGYDPQKMTNVVEDVERTPLCTVDEMGKWHIFCGKVWHFLQKLEELPSISAILLLGIHSKGLKSRVSQRYLYTHAHGIIHNSFVHQRVNG
jgi:hypothetical protein